MDMDIYRKVKNFVEKAGTTLEKITVKDFSLFLKANNLKFEDILKGESKWNVCVVKKWSL